MTKRQDIARHRADSSTGSLEILSKAVASNAGTMGRQAAVIAAAGGLVVTLGVTGTANSVQAAGQAPADNSTATLDVQRVAATNVVASKVSVKEFKKSLPVVKVKAAPAPEPVAEVSTLTETAESAAATAQTRADEQSASTQGEAYTAADRANEGSSSQGVTKKKKKKSVSTASDSSSQGGDAYTAADRANGGSSASSKPAKKASAPKTSGKASSSGVAGTALSYVGTPYVWGGKGPGGWDCSGFVSYVYRQHGMSIPSQTSAIRFSGKVKKVSTPQPGDLLFQRGGGHVAIYIGGGKYVGAQNPKVGTVVRSLDSTYDSFTGFYRYVG